MKKILLSLALVFSLCTLSKAEDGPKTLFDLGAVKIYIPLTSVDTSYLWDLVQKTSLVGAETPLGSWKRLTFTGGAVTSLEGQGTPFVGARLDLVNPVEPYVPVAAIHPGLFVGRDFRRNAWEYGLKFSVNVF